MNQADVPVLSCTLATLNALTGKRYTSVSRNAVVPVEATMPHQDSLENTILMCKENLLAQARKIDCDAIVVEAKYVSQDTVREMYATGIAVLDGTGQACY